MEATIEYEALLTLPDEIIKKFDIHPGDTVHFKPREDGGIELTFSKRESVEVELPEATLFALMLMAHERDITLNQLVTDILTAELT